MPTTQQQPKFTPQEAQRFAALVAGFDTGNPSEAEAVGKGRMMRRMAAAKGLRLVDVFELPEIRKAIDDQSQPVRKEGAELQAAMEHAAALREELTARTRDVRNLVEEVTALKELLLRRQREFDALQRRFAGATGGTSAPAATASPPARSRSRRPPMGRSWSFQVLAFFVLLVLEIWDWIDLKFM